MLEARHITKRFSGITALSEVNLVLHPGKVNAIIGENGAGKSTLMKIVYGAVTMVEAALKGLSERGVVQLDDERKAAMVSNLLVVLCSDNDAQPVINTGTLYS